MQHKLLIILIFTISLTACATNDPNRRTKQGAGIGAVSGAVIGYAISSGTSGVLIGAAVGALAGGGIGHYMDNQQKEYEAALAEEQRRHEIEIQRMQDETLKLSLNSEVSFAFGKASLKPAFYTTLDKLADVINKYDRTIIHVVGHTDSVGPADYNQQLSVRRANSVADYLFERGVSRNRVQTEGRGEYEPRATNDTEAGRQLNRRVEIYIKPIEKGREEEAYKSPRY